MTSDEAAVIDSVDLDAGLQRDAMPVNSAVEPALEEGVVINEVLRPSHHGPCVTFSKFVERFTVGVRLRRGVVHQGAALERKR